MNIERRWERWDLTEAVAALPCVAVAPKIGHMYAPIVVPGHHVAGFVACVSVAVGLQKPAPALAEATTRARQWLADTVAKATGAQRAGIAERLANVDLGLSLGAGGTGGGGTGGLTVQGQSWDAACVLAIVSHLLQRAPGKAWIVSAALGEPGELRAVGHLDDKTRIIGAETSHDDAVVLLADSDLEFDAVVARVLGEKALQELGALGTTASALLDEAGHLWRQHDEKGAAAKAHAAMGMGLTEAQQVMARLYIASQAIHVGDTDGAREALAAADAGLESIGSNAIMALADVWVVQEFRIRQAVLELDRLRPSVALGFLSIVDTALAETPAHFRDVRWRELLVQTRGTQSKALAFNGRLEDAIALRREALAAGPDDQKARSGIELAELLVRAGRWDDAKSVLESCTSDLRHISQESSRLFTGRFVRLARVRAGFEDGGIATTEVAGVPNLKEGPQPMEIVESLLRRPTGDRGALAWFEQHVFGDGDILNPALRYYYVTSCARAVARGFPDAHVWRAGAARLAAGLPDDCDAEVLAAVSAFTAGGPPKALLERALY